MLPRLLWLHKKYCVNPIIHFQITPFLWILYSSLGIHISHMLNVFIKSYLEVTTFISNALECLLKSWKGYFATIANSTARCISNWWNRCYLFIYLAIYVVKIASLHSLRKLQSSSRGYEICINVNESIGRYCIYNIIVKYKYARE